MKNIWHENKDFIEKYWFKFAVILLLTAFLIFGIPVRHTGSVEISPPESGLTRFDGPSWSIDLNGALDHSLDHEGYISQ
jgi:hypothetical protein